MKTLEKFLKPSIADPVIHILSLRSSVLVSLLYIAVRAIYWDFVALWDGKYYHNLLSQVVHGQSRFMDYAVSGHSSILYLYAFGWVERLFPGNVYAFNIFLTLWGVLGVYAFCEILEFFLSPTATRLELFLYGMIYAFHPAVLACCINFNVDEGVLVSFLMYWLAYLRGNLKTATLFAVVMLFSKESGVLLFPLPILASALFIRKRNLLNWARKRFFLILVPAVLFALYLGIRLESHSSNKLLFTGAKTDLGLIKLFLNPFPVSRITRTYLIQAFVFNFGWVITVALVSMTGVLIFKGSAKDSNRQSRKMIIQTLFILVSTAYLLTRYPTFTNVRYILPIFPVLILCTAQLSVHTIPWKGARQQLAGLILLLLLIGLTHSVDPVSRRIFGTFAFGKHPLFIMTSLTGEPPGLGRDVIVYNLEFTKFDTIQNQIYSDLRPSPETVIAVSPQTTFGDAGNLTTGPLNQKDFRRSYGGDGTFVPKYLSVIEALTQHKKPEELFYIELPNLRTPMDLIVLNANYEVAREKVYGSGGYRLAVIQFSSPRKWK